MLFLQFLQHFVGCVSEGKKSSFFGKFCVFLFLKHPFWDSPFCLITDEFHRNLFILLIVSFWWNCRVARSRITCVNVHKVFLSQHLSLFSQGAFLRRISRRFVKLININRINISQWKLFPSDNFMKYKMKTNPNKIILEIVWYHCWNHPGNF